jgi:DNA-binding protein H-NS
MPHTLAQINRRASAIRQQAERHKETIERIRADVVALQLTPSDIFPEGWPGFEDAAPAVSSDEVLAAAKYVDGPGRTWTGKGRRPSWLQEALERGAELDDFLIQRWRAQVPKARLQDIAHDRSPDGDEWHGKGRRPRWLATALEGGARLDDFAVLQSARSRR